MRVGPAPKAKVSFLGGTQKKSPAKRERVLGARFVLGDRDPKGPWKQMTAEPQGDGEAPKQCLRRARQNGAYRVQYLHRTRNRRDERNAVRSHDAASPLIDTQIGGPPSEEAVAVASYGPTTGQDNRTSIP